ncbi:MAG: c-type cytochrome [Pseudomonadota bacterium]|nr:c-type cytochrome [Pseudomonadota bacterium]
MKNALGDHRVWAAAVLALAAMGSAHAQQSAAAPAGSALAADMGCLNCHGTPRRGDAPEFRLLRERAVARSEERSALARHWVDEMRAKGKGWNAIVGHRQVSDDMARALAEWLTSPPPAQTVN